MIDKMVEEALARLHEFIRRSAAAHLGHMRKKWKESK